MTVRLVGIVLHSVMTVRPVVSLLTVLLVGTAPRVVPLVAMVDQPQP